jgi:hypothetical protein
VTGAGLIRLLRLYAAGRRVPAAAAAVAVCAAGLRTALLLGHWDAYGALQLPLVFEAAAGVCVAATAASPFGEPERVAGRLLPFVRLAVTAALTAAAAGALAAAGAGGQLAGGTLDVVRNTAGITGLGLLAAAALGGAVSWALPTAYLVAAIYALYTQWHGPALSTPWLWPARPPHDVGGAVCAAVVFAAGLAAVTWHGARDRDPAPG